MNQPFEVSGQLIDLFSRTIKAAKITVLHNRIHSITELKNAPNNYILPGFIDAHIHIESSMLTPSSFGAIAVKHGLSPATRPTSMTTLIISILWCKGKMLAAFAIESASSVHNAYAHIWNGRLC